jgi:hypothetical protein
VEDAESRLSNARAFVREMERYCWTVEGLEGAAYAVFHLLAAEGHTFEGRDHLWHLGIGERLAGADPDLFRPTRHRLVQSEREEHEASSWWERVTESEGWEGLVIKPLDYVPRGEASPEGEPLQPALKARGRSFLRLVYGMDYMDAENLERHRKRSVDRRRRTVLKEFSLGLEGLRRFVAGAPLADVHACALGVLALEVPAVALPPRRDGGGAAR